MDTNPSDIDILMARCLSRESAPAETDRLETLLNADPAIRTEFELLQLLCLDTGKLSSADKTTNDHLARVEKRLRQEGLL